MIRSFDPIIDGSCIVLILGTIPGKQSLMANEYYANRHNVFWKIVFSMLGTDVQMEYESRKQFLLKHRMALWDVLYECERTTSADSDIKSAAPNDFASLFRDYPGIRHVFFNGSNAEKLYMKHVAGAIGSKAIRYRRLPSTSPANALFSYEKKLEGWKKILDVPGLACSSGK